MTVSRLVSLKRAIMADLKLIQGVADVQPFGKLFEAEDIRHVRFISPCAFVSVLAAPGSEALPQGDSRTRVEVAVAVAANGKLGLPQDEETLSAAELVFKRARWQRWGMDRIWPVDKRRMEILPVPGRTGVALLAVRWEHYLLLDDADTDADEEVLIRHGDAPADNTVEIREHLP